MNLCPKVGSNYPLKNYYATFANGLGWTEKKLISKTASGLGKLYFYSLLYRPVPGDLKSGIPAATLNPAPVNTTTFL